MALIWSAKDSVVKLGVISGGSTLCVTSYSVTPSADILDTTNTCSAGYQNNITGIQQAKVNLKADYDSTATPFANFPGLNPGSLVVLTIFPVSQTGNPFIISGRVANVAVEGQIRGKVSYSVDFESNGSFTLPF